MAPAAYSSAEEDDMDGVIRKLVCCMLLLGLAGTASATYGAAMTGPKVPGNQPVAGLTHGDEGLLRVTGELRTNDVVSGKCYFPVWRLPEYYICIMFCRIGGGGDSCPGSCEARLSICT